MLVRWPHQGDVRGGCKGRAVKPLFISTLAAISPETVRGHHQEPAHRERSNRAKRWRRHRHGTRATDGRSAMTWSPSGLAVIPPAGQRTESRDGSGVGEPQHANEQSVSWEILQAVDTDERPLDAPARSHHSDEP